VRIGWDMVNMFASVQCKLALHLQMIKSFSIGHSDILVLEL
jgi:hypothetical protein